ncbi:hypothetical protein Pmani_000039 [Petrolisthes manimaculis]|uniref:ATP-dependent RNA helicase DHX34 n=1 Tax=Petrolisthes manimaculis TaxID=1843537 RepID=A0AAE1QQZ2_9EUCA|nr:hypothetical protein Pmani_000039 [Petrolisthes manimaculis]
MGHYKRKRSHSQSQERPHKRKRSHERGRKKSNEKRSSKRNEKERNKNPHRKNEKSNSDSSSDSEHQHESCSVSYSGREKEKSHGKRKKKRKETKRDKNKKSHRKYKESDSMSSKDDEPKSDSYSSSYNEGKRKISHEKRQRDRKREEKRDGSKISRKEKEESDSGSNSDGESQSASSCSDQKQEGRKRKETLKYKEKESVVGTSMKCKTLKPFHLRDKESQKEDMLHTDLYKQIEHKLSHGVKDGESNKIFPSGLLQLRDKGSHKVAGIQRDEGSEKVSKFLENRLKDSEKDGKKELKSKESLQLINKKRDEAHHGLSKHAERENNGDSEEELMFDWESHRPDLDRMFFGSDDAIKRGSEEHRDFWAFLKKYQGLQKQKKIREMCGRECVAENRDKNKDSYKRREGKEGASTQSDSSPLMYELPHPYDKRYSVNFGLSLVDVEVRRSRLPPRDLEDGRRELSKKKLVEFKLVLLLYLDFLQKQKFEKLKKLRAAQANLPIADYREEIVSRVRENSVVIVAGDTGCGKSTQVPQYLLAAGYGNMACTQPRRIACISLAKRVAYETLHEFGSQVGYQIRFEKKRTEHTKIVFVTEGLLLRQAAADGRLSQYEVVILDEVHVRNLDTDLLLGVVKVLVHARPDLRVVLMSATINLELFVKYFQGRAPAIQVPGRLHPITLHYQPIPSLDLASKREKIDPGPYLRVLQLVDHKYPPDERGDLLIFLSGVSEIGTVVEAVRAYGEESGRWVVLPLHSTLPVSEQEKVFHVPPDGVRKCIISTNIAETSVTIDGVRFVVDSGKMKEMNYDAQSKMRRLKEFWISQASAEQRKGRAGRTGPGICFRLYSEKDYAAFSSYDTPEIQRVPLDSLVLRLSSMGLKDTRLFPFVEPPPPESLEHALTALKSQDALTPGESLTTLGKLLAQLPVDVSLAKMLIMGSLFHQVEPVLSLAAVMSVKSPVTPRARRDPDCLNSMKELESDHGDPLTLLTAYREWLGVKVEGGQDSRRWCRRRGLEEQRFYETTKLRHQFSRLLHSSGLHDIGGKSRAYMTTAERAKRIGQLKQLRELKSQLHKEDGPRRTKVLKMGYGDMGSDDEGTDIKDVDFRISYDHKQLGEIRRGSWVRSDKDMVMLKLVLCSGLYPNLAIADEHNSYKPGSEQLFHTPLKPFAALHPTGVFSASPEILQIPDSEIFELPGFTTRHPASTRHLLLAYVSLLETHKVYLVDTLRVPAAQILLLFSRSIDTNADMTRVACDSFIEFKFPDAASAQNLIFRAVQLRVKWQRLLDLRIEASGALHSDTERHDNDASEERKDEDRQDSCTRDWSAEQDRQDRHSQLNREADSLEKDLTAGLVDFYHSQCLYSQRRLLQADVNLLHSGPGPLGPCNLTPNPFSSTRQEMCRPNDIKGGVDMTDFLTYDCLLDTECEVFSITSYETVCPYCDMELHMNTLERLGHMVVCLEGAVVVPEPTEGAEHDQGHEDDPWRKKYECEVCGKTLRLSIKEILQHKKSHQN